MSNFLLDEQTRGAEGARHLHEREPFPENPVPGRGAHYAIRDPSARGQRGALSSTTALTPTATLGVPGPVHRAMGFRGHGMPCPRKPMTSPFERLSKPG